MSRLACVAALALASVAPPSAALEWPGRAEAVAERFESARDAARRAEAVRELGALSPSLAIEVLRIALEDSSSEVRAAACTSAATVGAVELEPSLVQRLGDRASSVQTAAASALGELRAHSATEPLARLLADRNVDVRVAAVRALARVGNPESVIAVSGVLSDPSRDVVVAALEALGSLGQPGTAYAVLEKATDPSEEVAVTAVRALIALRSSVASGAMIELMNSGRTSVALASIEGLGALRAHDGVPALVAEVISPHVDGGREAALGALVAIASPDAIEPLTPLLLTNPSVVSDYFASVGVAGWDAFRSVAERVPVGESLNEGTLRAWLRSGDPEAVAAVSAASDPTRRFDLLRESPTAHAFCAAVDLGVDRDFDPVEMADWAVRAGAVNCLGSVLDSAALGTDAALAIAASVAPSDPSLALELLDTHVAARSLDWSEAAPLVAAVNGQGSDGVALLEVLAFAEDRRLRVEAVAALIDVADRIPPRLQVALGDVATRQPDWIDLLRIGLDAGDEGAASLVGTLARDRQPTVRAAAVGVLAHTCVGGELAAEAAGDGSYWVRRAAFEYGLRCGSVAPSDSDFDPVARRLGLDALSDDALVGLASDEEGPDYLRVGAIRLLESRGEGDQARHLRRSRSAFVAAAAWLSGTVDLGGEELGMRAVAAAHEAERAAMFQAAQGTLPEPMVVHALRREAGDGARRVLEHADAFGDGVVVYLVDRESGQPRQDEDVFVIRTDGDFDIFRSGPLGLVVIPDDDIRAVFVSN